MKLSKYHFIFSLTIFILLSITSAGIFLNDEWIVAQQENQLSQFHQITYNEGKYGYFMNGTPNEYMSYRSNYLIYPIALPIISLPSFYLFMLLGSFTRIFIILFWFIMGLMILYYIKNNIKKQIYSQVLLFMLIIITILNLILISPFQMSGEYVPYEIIPIVFTNILIFGIYSTYAYKLSEIFFSDYKQIFVWMSCLSCTSLLFWVGTLKDHVLLSTIILLMCYYLLQSFKEDNFKNNAAYLILSGLSLWIRPEVGLFVIISVIIIKIMRYKTSTLNMKNIIYSISLIGIGAIPFFINNWIVTGSPFKNIFILSQYPTSNGGASTQLSDMLIHIPHSIINAFDINAIIRLFVAPSSGAIGLIVTLSLFFFGICILLKYRPSLDMNTKTLIIVGISSIFYYIIYAATFLESDGGIVPDIRYFTPAYALFIISTFSIIPYELNYKKMIKYLLIIVPCMFIFSLCLIGAYIPLGETYKTFRILPEIISCISFAIMLILLINDKTTSTKPLEVIIPISISSPLIWQIIMIFIYNVSKAHYYPMFLPIVEILHKLIFGG